MNYLSKPITGLTTKISQLFSGRVTTSGLANAGLTKMQYQLLFYYCAAVVGLDGTLLIKKFYLEL